MGDETILGKGDLTVELKDEDKLSKHDTMGTICISEADILRIWQQGVGESRESSYNITGIKDGKQVMGHDKKPSTVTLSIGVVGAAYTAPKPSPPAAQRTEVPAAVAEKPPLRVPEGKAASGNQLRVTLVKASSLPKADMVRSSPSALMPSQSWFFDAFICSDAGFANSLSCLFSRKCC